MRENRNKAILRIETVARVLANGYLLKSKYINRAINIFAMPNKENLRSGFTFGFDRRK
jgi:hypothetical protein|tara:strand:- start:408 stop:581 length:174 start_codon:yes stop_codon:yes gene_type:complete